MRLERKARTNLYKILVENFVFYSKCYVKPLKGYIERNIVRFAFCMVVGSFRLNCEE